MPREEKLVLNSLLIRVRTPWTIEVSLFREYLREDNLNLTKECFELDWACMKQLKYKHSTEEKIKEVMREAYPMIKEAYKVLAGYGMQGTISSVALNTYTDFIKD